MLFFIHARTIIGHIQSTDLSVPVGESVMVTCSTVCAWDWHTFWVDDSFLRKNRGSNEVFMYNIENEILNCPDCSEPYQLDCSNGNEGTVRSILNFTFITSGYHYVQCFAHMFDQDSNLWPTNQVISIPSRTLRIEAIG